MIKVTFMHFENYFQKWIIFDIPYNVQCDKWQSKFITGIIPVSNNTNTF